MATLEERRSELERQKAAVLAEIESKRQELSDATPDKYTSRGASQRRRQIRRKIQSLDTQYRGVKYRIGLLEEEERAARRAAIKGTTPEEELRLMHALSQQADAIARREAARARSDAQIAASIGMTTDEFKKLTPDSQAAVRSQLDKYRPRTTREAARARSDAQIAASIGMTTDEFKKLTPDSQAAVRSQLDKYRPRTTRPASQPSLSGSEPPRTINLTKKNVDGKIIYQKEKTKTIVVNTPLRGGYGQPARGGRGVIDLRRDEGAAQYIRSRTTTAKRYKNLAAKDFFPTPRRTTTVFERLLLPKTEPFRSGGVPIGVDVKPPGLFSRGVETRRFSIPSGEQETILTVSRPLPSKTTAFFNQQNSRLREKGRSSLTGVVFRKAEGFLERPRRIQTKVRVFGTTSTDIYRFAAASLRGYRQTWEREPFTQATITIATLPLGVASRTPWGQAATKSIAGRVGLGALGGAYAGSVTSELVGASGARQRGLIVGREAARLSAFNSGFGAGRSLATGFLSLPPPTTGKINLPVVAGEPQTKSLFLQRRLLGVNRYTRGLRTAGGELRYEFANTPIYDDSYLITRAVPRTGNRYIQFDTQGKQLFGVRQNGGYITAERSFRGFEVTTERAARAFANRMATARGRFMTLKGLSRSPADFGFSQKATTRFNYIKAGVTTPRSNVPAKDNSIFRSYADFREAINRKFFRVPKPQATSRSLSALTSRSNVANTRSTNGVKIIKNVTPKTEGITVTRKINKSRVANIVWTAQRAGLRSIVTPAQTTKGVLITGFFAKKLSPTLSLQTSRQRNVFSFLPFRRQRESTRSISINPQKTTIVYDVTTKPRTDTTIRSLSFAETNTRGSPAQTTKGASSRPPLTPFPTLPIGRFPFVASLRRFGGGRGGSRRGGTRKSRYTPDLPSLTFGTRNKRSRSQGVFTGFEVRGL